MANPHIAVIRLTESGSFDPDVRDTLIVGPGMGTSVNGLFTETAQQLTNRFQVIGFDLPGHGQSPAHNEAISIEDLSDAIAQLVQNLHQTGTIRGESKVYFAGLSISGQIALQLALEHAELFDGIAVLASAPKIGTKADWDERSDLVKASGTEAMVDMSAQLWVSEGFDNSAKLDVQKQAMVNADDQSYAALCKALGNYDATDRLHEIAVPIFAVAGGQDQMCTVADAQNTASKVQHGTSAVIEQAAHLLPLEQPEQLATLLESKL
ncbi:MAG TPA: alpha/beta hydrolase [Candidatus Yaniella excrementigallinarum]|nr:alpha/beta hydrolase [Candidatus Yaniella excrementigallinarum]